MSPARDPGACVLLFFLSFFALLTSGRVASSDAGHQLQASTLLALTGRLGDDGAAGGLAGAGTWVRAPGGRYFQAHDIGNVVLMLPAAWVGARLSSAPPAEDVRNPPPLARAGASLTCAALAAVGCFWLFRLFALYWPPGPAFLLALAFPGTTIFIAYARSAWDVLGGAVMMCGVLYYSASAIRGRAPAVSALSLSAALAGVCSFRFSMAPFVVPAACLLLYGARRTVPWRSLAGASLIFAAMMTPSFVYNAVRTGSPLRPATAGPEYLYGANALTGSVLEGLYGLVLSPNRGLLTFSPILIFALAVPFLRRRMPGDQRRLLFWYGLGSCAYAVLISMMDNWGSFGWGPRYLVPILPVIFTAAAVGMRHLFESARPLVIAVAAVSAVLSVPPALVNWHLATTTYDGAPAPDAALPFQQVAAWRALASGLRGEPLPVPDDAAADPLRATTAVFPDLLIARVARHSAAGFAAAAVGAAIAMLAAVRCLRRIVAGAGVPPGLPHGTAS